MTSSSSSKDASYSAFREVDDLVSKPVLGSDGSASWQEFKKNQRHEGPSVAPTLPMKRTAKLGTGFSTLEQEREHENKMRAEAGDAMLGSGYIAFKRKVDPSEVAEKKRLKKVMERVRPDNATYYIPSATFQGWREDYVFTTRERGVGYYWDGSDSYKKAFDKTGEKAEDASKDESNTSSKSLKSTTKKTTTRSTDPVSIPIPTPSNVQQSEISASTAHADSLDLVHHVLHQKNNHAVLHSNNTPSMADIDRAVLTGSLSLSNIMSKATPRPNTTIMKQWESAKDPTSGREYYFCRATGESTWEKPTST